MANRFPLIVNSATKKIEELVAGDNIDLTSSGLVANNTLGTSGQYLKTNGTTVVWDNPGDVYLTTNQTITNKTIESSFLSGTTNTFTNIPNSALVNNSITVNGVAIALGGTVTTPDNNTTYSISAQDGAAGKKIIRLTSGGNFGAGVDDDVTLVAGSNVTLSRTGDEITINSSYIDTNTITRVAASGGNLVSGDITLSAANSNITISQVGNTISFATQDNNTVTRLRGTASGTYVSGDLSLLAGSNVTISQGSSPNTDFTISSQDTITRVRATGGALLTGDVTFAVNTAGTTTLGANGVYTTTGAASITQSGSTITIDATYDNTVTSLKANTEADGNARTGIVSFTGSGATTVSRSGSTFTITSTDTNTTYTAGNGITLSGTTFSLKNNANLTNSRLVKWDTGNNQFINSIISDDGSTVTVSGDFKVTGTTSTIESQTLIVSDAQIELRKGLNLTGVDAGIQVNRTTNALGVVSSYSVMQWFESGGYWRVYDGSVSNRLVTEGETQTLTNKTLTSPTLTTPTLGVATATTINGLTISQTVSGVLTIANSKTLTCNNTLTFSGTDSSTVGFGAGGTVAYTSNKLSVFAATTSAELRGVLSDETGTGVAVFGTSPTITTSILTGSTSFDLFNTTATTINFGGAATSIVIGATTGTTRVRNNLQVDGNMTFGDVVGDTVTVNGTATFTNADINIRSTSPIAVGRGGGSVASNTRVGFNALNSNSTGSQNTAFGYEAALTINSGAGVVAMGYRALRSASTGQYNIAIGRDALTGLLLGERNVGVGANTLEGNTTGNDNVAIGYYAGAGATGSGNVLIGPAPDGNSTNVTHTPPTPSGNNQLVIGSGTGTWVRGDSNFDITLPQNANVGGNLTVSGSLTVNGTSTVINTNILEVDDKEISIGAVVAKTFTATITSNSANISAITPVAGLIPGQVVSITTAGLSVPAGTTIVSITNNTAVLSNVVTGSSGTATFSALGASDTTADGGGIRIKGTTDKTIQYTNATTAFTSSEHFDLATGKQYRIGNVQIANGATSTLGPTSGTWSLGAGVTGSSLTSVGTLTSLSTSGAISSSFSTVGSAALTITNDAATGLANNTFSISKTVKGGIHFGNAAGTGGAARQAAITFRGNTSDEAQAGIYVINNNTIGTAMVLATTDNYTTGPKETLKLSHDGVVTVSRNNLVLGRIDATNEGGQVTFNRASDDANYYAIDVYGNTSTPSFRFLNANTSTTLAQFSSTGDFTVSAGNLVIGTAGKGIDFSANANAAGMTSEVLNDYEEGTWTPEFSRETLGNLSVTYSSRSGTYTKIGNVVSIRFRMRISTISYTTGSGAFVIDGLPFASNNPGDDHTGVSVAGYENLPIGSTEQLINIIDDNSTRIRLLKSQNSAGWADVNIASGTSAIGIYASFTYCV